MESPTANGNLGLTFEQEQTADELLADIQNAVDEMLQDFQTSPITTNPPPVAPKTKRIQPVPAKKTPPAPKPPAPAPAPVPSGNSSVSEHTVHIKSRNGGFGFQIMGGVDSELPAQVDYIVPGESNCLKQC